MPRCGDVAAAVQAARNAGPGLSDTHTLLQELVTSSDNRLSPQTEGMAKLQYRRLVKKAEGVPFCNYKSKYMTVIVKHAFV